MAAKKNSQFDKSAYDTAYQKEYRTRVSVILNKKHDSDIIQHLEIKPSKSDYIKQLIRKDINSRND